MWLLSLSPLPRRYTRCNGCEKFVLLVGDAFRHLLDLVNPTTGARRQTFHCVSAMGRLDRKGHVIDHRRLNVIPRYIFLVNHRVRVNIDETRQTRQDQLTLTLETEQRSERERNRGVKVRKENRME